MNKEYPPEVLELLNMLIAASHGEYLEETTRQFAAEALRVWDETR
ncbi:MAG: hypothetical protein ACRC68_05870 [Clostridium sp.]